MTRLQKIAFFHPLITTFCIFLLSFSIISFPVYISYINYKAIAFENFKTHIKELSSSLANSIDGDLHKQITKPSDENSPIFKKAITPLIKFHNANPKILYVYTMIEKDKKAYYILDTMADERLNIGRPPLESTEIMEEVYVALENQDNWLEVVNDGEVYVTPDFETDNYGTFLSGHAPFYDAQGNIAGIIGIDYDTKTYQAHIKDYKVTFYYLLLFCFAFTLIITFILFLFIHKLRENYKQIKALSTYDYLTGVYNRRSFETLVKESIKRQNRSEGKLFLVIIDIDNFKEINDIHGHQVGDIALKAASEKISSELRSSDILARFGGDEFLILISDKNDEAAAKLIQRVQKAFSHFALTLKDDTSLYFSLSIGYTDYKKGCDFESMLTRADNALYKSKKEGKNKSSFLPADCIF